MSSTKTSKAEKLTTSAAPSPPPSRRPPSPARTKERTSSSNNLSATPSNNPNNGSKQTFITSSSPSSESPIKTRDSKEEKDKEKEKAKKRERTNSSPSILASPPLGSPSRSSLTTSKEKLATLSPTPSFSASTSPSKQDSPEGGTQKSYRKRLPPRLQLGDEKDDSYSIRFSPDNQFVVAGGGDGSIRVFNSATGKLTYLLISSIHLDTPVVPLIENYPASDNLPVTCLRFRPNTQFSTTKNILLAGYANGTVKHWHATTGKCVHTITEEDNQVYAVDYRHDAEYFATAGKDFKIRVYDESKRTLVSTLSGGHKDITAGHASRVFSLKFNPAQSDIIISGGWDNTIQIWDTRVSYSVRSIYGPHICGDAMDIHGETILSGSWRPEKALQTWDFGSGRLIDTFDWRPSMGEEPCMLYAAQFSKGNNAEYIAAGGSGSNEAKIFNHKTKQILGEIYGFRKGIYSLDFSSDSKMLVVGGSGILQLFELHLND